MQTVTTKRRKNLKSATSLCAYCQNQFQCYPWRKQKFCGMKCFGKAKTDPKKRTCAVCGIAKGYGSLRCQPCYYASRENGKEYPCANCGTKIRMTPGKMKGSSRKFGVFCNHKCFSNFVKGKNNMAYIDGRQPALYPSGYRRARRQTLERDGGKCFLCQDVPERSLDVHHIDRDKSNNNLWNLVALCRLCHNHQKGEDEQDTLRLANVMYDLLQKAYKYRMRSITSKWTVITISSARES